MRNADNSVLKLSTASEAARRFAKESVMKVPAETHQRRRRKETKRQLRQAL